MKIKTLAFTLALLFPMAAQAAQQTPAPKKECCCKDADDKMACCDKMKGGTGDGDAHAGHEMSGKDKK